MTIEHMTITFNVFSDNLGISWIEALALALSLFLMQCALRSVKKEIIAFAHLPTRATEEESTLIMTHSNDTESLRMAYRQEYFIKINSVHHYIIEDRRKQSKEVVIHVDSKIAPGCVKTMACAHHVFPGLFIILFLEKISLMRNEVFHHQCKRLCVPALLIVLHTLVLMQDVQHTRV